MRVACSMNGQVAQTCITIAGGFLSLCCNLRCVLCVSVIRMDVYGAGIKRMHQSTLNESNVEVEFDTSDLIR